MPMFQIEAGRSVVLPSPSGAHGETVPAASDVGDRLDALLGEHLLPLRARSCPDDPHLLAVDASGQPVVVEVVGLLDEAACLRALRHAGRAAGMGEAELAAAYEAGPQHFASHLEAFRASLPAAGRRSGGATRGARLLLVCSEVAPATEPLLDFLLQPGWPVQVLQVKVSAGPDGRQVVDVRPVRGVAAAPPATHAPRRDRRPPVGALRSASARPPVVVPPDFAVRVGAVRGPGTPTPRETADTAPQPVVDDRLVRLAGRLGRPTVLLWNRVRRGSLLEALLHPDGVIELPDGTRHASPDAAAAAATGAPYGSGVPRPRPDTAVPPTAVPDAPRQVDGWRVWRVGSQDGPTLAEVWAAQQP